MKKIFFFIYVLFVANYISGQKNSYELSYTELYQMLLDDQTMNLKKAIYNVENAYFEGQLNYKDFGDQLQQYVSFIKLVSANNLISYSHADFQSVNTHAAIFRVMTDSVPISISGTTIIYHLPFQYNFDDYAGKKDWSNMFVSTLMTTHKGNCHSLPLFYKLLAEELGEKSWLAIAPNHAYIKLHNQADGWYNVELTSGSFPTDVWIKASGYIHTDAIRNGIYMDTLSLKSTIAICLTDLAEGYKHKYPLDYANEFILKCCDRALDVFPNYINALLLKAETLLDMHAKMKKEEYLRDAEKLYMHIHQLGYRKMPEKMYLEWLKSLDRYSNTH